MSESIRQFTACDLEIIYGYSAVRYVKAPKEQYACPLLCVSVQRRMSSQGETHVMKKYLQTRTKK